MKKNLLAISTLTALLLTGCAGTKVSSFKFNNGLNVNEAQKAPKCYDASVLLAHGLEDTKSLSKKVLVAIDATIKKETESTIDAQRNRHIGLVVGGGGEELFLTLKEVDSSKTFVTATTKTGFVGGAGMKAWSCKIVDELIKLAK